MQEALIRAFDMGGQFYSRQNTGFKAYTADPLAPSTGTGTGTPTNYPMP